MKKLLAFLLAITMVLLSFAACNNGDNNQGNGIDSNAFNLVYNKSGEYISLGMTREEVEQIITFEYVEYHDEVFFEFIGSTKEGLTIFFDENETVIRVSIFDNDTPLWFVRGDITTGFNLEDERFEEIWNLNYAHVAIYADIIADYTFFFTSDHSLVEYEAENKHYGVAFLAFESVGIGWEVGRIDVGLVAVAA